MSSNSPILFAEDDENDALLFRLALRKAGVTNPVVHAEDGEAALNYLGGVGSFSDHKQYPLPCLLVIDLKMPKVTGFDVLSWLRSQMPANRLPAIILSGSEQEPDKKRALDLGAKAYWVKPTDLAELVHLLQGLSRTWLASPSHA
jgi:CheY-like chemotaxis protein